jgi:hypothetical protein
MRLPGLMGSYPDVLAWVASGGGVDGITPGTDRVQPDCMFAAVPGAGEGAQGAARNSCFCLEDLHGR